MDGFIDPDVGPLPRLDLSGASQLRELHLAAYPYTLLYGVPLGQLTTLRMDGRGLAEDLTILRSCKSLVKLTLRKGDPELNLILPSSPEVVHLPHLESLVVTSSSIFKYLFLPLLRRLQFPLTRKGVADLLPLIAKWGCTLESLVVALGNPYDILRQLLAATPSLKELHLDFSLARSNWTTTVLRNTNVLPTTVEMLDVDDIVPQLEALRITWYAYAQYIPRELKSFLRKKALESKSGGVFKSFTLMLPHCMEELVGSSLVGELKVLSDNEFKADIVTRANASQ
ncbi:hypothetical protein C8F01DRAFT_1150308 [Mycena amicta]|nr:hypothetical protein C8F01DRAFT_1150308 [Mycena amicta]